MIFVHNVKWIMLINLLYYVVLFCCNRPCCTDLWGWKNYVIAFGKSYLNSPLCDEVLKNKHGQALHIQLFNCTKCSHNDRKLLKVCTLIFLVMCSYCTDEHPDFKDHI